MLDPALGEDVAIADCPKTTMIESSNGIKIGVIGLGEREWYVKNPRPAKSFIFLITLYSIYIRIKVCFPATGPVVYGYVT